MAEVRVWMGRNKLKLKDGKTVCMVITSKSAKQMPELVVQMGDELIRPKLSKSNLGATLDSDLSMKAQVNRDIRSATTIEAEWPGSRNISLINPVPQSYMPP